MPALAGRAEAGQCVCARVFWHVAGALMRYRPGDAPPLVLHSALSPASPSAPFFLSFWTPQKQHFAIVSHFTSLHRLTSGSSGAASSGPAAAAATSTSSPGLASSPSMERTRSGGYANSGVLPIVAEDVGAALSTSSASSTHSGTNTPRGASGLIFAACPPSGPCTPMDEAERSVTLQMAMKVSDLGHMCLPTPVNIKWVMRLEDEFFQQGDKERSLGEWGERGAACSGQLVAGWCTAAGGLQAVAVGRVSLALTSCLFIIVRRPAHLPDV